MTIVLDTNVCIEILRTRDPKVLARYRETDPDTIVLPSMVAAELLVGAQKSTRPNSKDEVESFLAGHSIVAFGESEMRLYASIRTHLESAGQKIGGNDLVIAATVLGIGATLVTHNTREFGRIPGLPLLDWQA